MNAMQHFWVYNAESGFFNAFYLPRLWCKYIYIYIHIYIYIYFKQLWPSRNKHTILQNIYPCVNHPWARPKHPYLARSLIPWQSGEACIRLYTVISMQCIGIHMLSSCHKLSGQILFSIGLARETCISYIISHIVSMIYVSYWRMEYIMNHIIDYKRLYYQYLHIYTYIFLKFM